MPLAVPKLPAFRPPSGGLLRAGVPGLARFSGAGGAGPRRILAIAAGGVALGVVVAGLTFGRGTPPPVSRPGPPAYADPVPGGVRSNPHQDDLALRDAQDAAARQRAAGRSFTPQIASGQEYTPKPGERPLLTAPSPPSKQTAATAPTPAATVAPAVTPAAAAATVAPKPAATAVAAPKPAAPADPAMIKVADAGGQAQAGQTQGGQVDPRYKAAIDKMMGGWGARPPRTDVVLPADEEAASAPGPARAIGRGTADLAPAGAPSAAAPVAARAGRPRVLIPAGRGVYGHTVMGVNSDAPGAPVILEADSGPIARARLIGAFTREGDRVVIRGGRIQHAGQELNAEWIVVAPDTLEATVASGVEQHLLGRFVLPAAASFVQGLGQALALSNSALTTNAFGGLTAFQRLNLPQQLGVAAGVAAGRIGQTLDQAAPRGPTVRVDRQVPVGIMFLSNVALPD